ncbi:unnamed protein product [Rangifer tarandus platyrhynchus]|uniref:Uncharacterized protein n=1 Tax=Rangifer tarandus platyrhynchus TaxID=3082113 RepID=A0AC59Z1H5_RANTA
MQPSSESQRQGPEHRSVGARSRKGGEEGAGVQWGRGARGRRGSKEPGGVRAAPSPAQPVTGRWGRPVVSGIQEGNQRSGPLSQSCHPPGGPGKTPSAPRDLA